MSKSELDREARVQREKDRPEGFVAWSEHVEAWNDYASKYGPSQSAERINERGGFGYYELSDLLGHEPLTWRPR